MFVLTQARLETDGKALGVLPTPTPGREAESLMGHPLSFFRGRCPHKQTKVCILSTYTFMDRIASDVE